MKEITLKDSATPEDKDQEVKQNEKGEEIQEQPQGTNDLPKEWRYVHNHPKELIIGDPMHGVKTRSSLRDVLNHCAFVSQLEPKTFEEAENDHN